MSRDSQFEKVVSKLYGEMDQRITRIGTYMRSEQVPGTQKAPEDAQLRQFAQVRDNPAAWAQLIQQKGMKSAIKYNEFGERLLHKWQNKAYKEMGLDTAQIPPPRKTNPALVQALMQNFQQIQQQAQAPAPTTTPEQGAQQLSPQPPQAPPTDPSQGGMM